MKKQFLWIFAITLVAQFSYGKTQKVTLAGGCFWCMEAPFEKLDGVKSAVSGFMGGKIKNPSYKQVAQGGSGHLEVVQITYDSDKVSFEDLLQVFWRNINPTDAGGQFVDRGDQYSTAIFYYSPEQENAAKTSKLNLNKTPRFSGKIITPIRKASDFYPAEDYHQDFYKKSTIKYKYYRYRSGRDEYLDKTWGKDREYSPKKKGTKMSKYTKPDDKKLKETLTPLQYKVTQKEGTERPFKNEYWDNKKEGIYVDVTTGEPLFSSQHKYKSGTGWPSFYKPIVPDYIVEKEDRGLFSVRTEIRSKVGDAHLGHVFKDGPEPSGLRYCMNSAAMKFIPKEEMNDKGYGEYLSDFATASNDK